jgi:hypothetical protein
MRLHLSAGEKYQQAAASVVERRVAQAGIRLAMTTLNHAVASARPAD